ncbi:Putative FAD/NAD(P)-binding domain superfamily [Colletotrichum destructivum]|uniref:FAD/NAD(P)-binding domain superfamily n=1 Tax=Colletotrichum destructivum TaxID=34406 RepID=A0AAX4IUS0_9PEZI|nr:Putative FAD/NAD(P)-binding domain superfamily [Colletotrichum destructivum]
MTVPTPNIDLKYAEEREKRIRPEGMAQFVELKDELGDLSKDLYVNYEELSRDQPLSNGQDVKLLIIGAGHNGLLAAVRLIQAGGLTAEDIVLVDKAGGHGGTWYYNRYPGLTCDVEGYTYVPLLEETGYKPKHRYCEGQEIREQAERIARTWNLKAQFGTRVQDLSWDDTTARWSVKMTQDLGPSKPGRELSVTSQFVYVAPGVYPVGHIPKLAGFDDFRKHHSAFHTAGWDYAVTGGTQQDPRLTELRDKRVAVVGTGATGVQVVPKIAEWAKHLYVFQRTPSYCWPRKPALTDDKTWSEVVAQGPGWQKARQENYNAAIAGETDVDLVNDSWTAAKGFSVISGSSANGIITMDKIPQHMASLQAVDAPLSEALRKRVEEEVRDKATAEKLKPWYYGWCKRPAFHDTYLSTFNRDNVTLVDTDGKGVEGCTANGVLANGREYEVDVLILATGYTNGGGACSPAARGGMRITGRAGRDLNDKFDEGWESLHGVATNGFPNLFFYTPTGAAGSSNFTFCLDEGARQSAYIITEALRRTTGDPGKVVVEVTEEGEQAWGTEVAKRAAWFAAFGNCTPSYLTAEGDAYKIPPEKMMAKARMASWGEGPNSYARYTEAYRAAGTLDGIKVSA